MNSLFTKTNVSCLLILLSLNAVYAGTNRVGINGAACAYASVSEAIDNAAAGDTIYISPGTYEELLGKIKLDLTLVPSESAGPAFSGCEQEMISATSATVIIDGEGATAEIQGGLVQISQSATVTFRHMWLRNSKADFGGVIAVLDGSELTLEDVLITDGAAQQAGGNIYLESSSSLQVFFDSSVYRGTSNFVGGAIALFDSSMTVSDGNIGVSGNNGFSKAGTDGGGIYAENSDVFLNSSQSILQWNEAARHGGGLYAVNSVVNLTSAFVNDNTAEASGGGLYLDDSELVMLVAKVNDNSALGGGVGRGGGGAFLTDGSTADLRSVQFTGNDSGNLGGGILATLDTQITLERVTIENNQAVSMGGGISTSGSLVVDDTNILNNSAQSGGGIYCVECLDINIFNDSTIRENHATAGLGGGLYINEVSASHVTQITDSEFVSNDSFSLETGEGFGGGISMNSGILKLTSSLIQNNQASLRGGGIHTPADLFDELSIELNNVVFQQNQVVERPQVFGIGDGGGALGIANADSLHINNCSFDGNTSGPSGGGARLNNIDLLQVSGSLFFENQGSSGGGISMFRTTGEIRNSRFINNDTTIFGGGALSLNDSNLNVINSIFDGNTGGTIGGAISVRVNSELTIDTEYGTGAGQCNPSQLGFNEYCSALINNHSNEGGGAVFAIFGSVVNIKNTFISGNTAEKGSAVLTSDSDVFDDVVINMENVLITDNGISGDSTSVIEISGNSNITMNSITVAENQGAPLLIQNFDTEVELTNSIIFDNTAAPEVAFGSSFTRSCNNSQAPSPSSQTMGGNLGDPLFETTSRGDYRLSDTSPSHNACTSGPLGDLDGLFRNDGTGLYDQGAFELGGLEVDPDIIFVDGFE